MIWLFFLWSFLTSNAGQVYCFNEVVPGAVYDQCTVLVPGTAMTYKNGIYTWAGNPMCIGDGFNYTLQPTSPAIDAGDTGCVHTGTFQLQCQTGPDDTPPNSTINVSTLHCPNPGSALNQPRLPDQYNSYCLEWYGKGPDIGACEFVPPPSGAPSGLVLK